MRSDHHILFLTSNNLASNPRCLKEVKLAAQLGASVTIVAFNLHNWTTEKEIIIRKELTAVEFYYLEATRRSFFSWVLSSAIEKAGRFLLVGFPYSLFLSSMAVSKRSWLLLGWIKKNKVRPDLIIAHNPAAFYPAFSMAKKNNIPFALDIEDYHPGETLPGNVKKNLQMLMSKLIPKAAYVSYASPLIKEYSEKLFAKSGIPSFVINNYFPKEYFIETPTSSNEKLQMVWFSQNIDSGRGLEELLAVYENYTGLFELTLIGNPKESFCKEYIENKKGITVINALHPEVLTKTIGQFDIGLAIEPGKDLNNTLALSNKILSYFQAGLYILASGTAAQRLFMQQHPDHGVCTLLSRAELGKTLESLALKKNAIRSLRPERFKRAAAYNWENESLLLLKEWETILQ